MTVRELRVIDVRCRAEECGAGPGEDCAFARSWWPARIARLAGVVHEVRIADHAELVAAGWKWQAAEPNDAGAADRHREFCTKLAWCTLTAGHGGECLAEVPIVPHKRQDWDLRTRDPSGWAERKRSR